MSSPEDLLILDSIGTYNVKGLKKVFISPKTFNSIEKTENWGFFIAGNGNVEDIVSLCKTLSFPPEFGIINIPETLSIHQVMKLRRAFQGMDIPIIGNKYPAILSQDFSITPFEMEEFKEGSVSVMTRSSAMLKYIVSLLFQKKIGIRWGISLGEDILPVKDFIETMEFFEKDERTRVIVIINEWGYNYSTFKAVPLKPVIALIGGLYMPELENPLVDFVKSLGIVLPQDWLMDLQKKNVHIVHTFKDIISLIDMEI